MAALRLDQTRAGAAGAAISAPAAQAIPRPGRYEIDISCSAVTFRTRHLFGLAPCRGRFAIRAGTIDVGEPLARTGAFVQIDAASFAPGTGSGTTRSGRSVSSTLTGTWSSRSVRKVWTVWH
jgi:hypothetical protein